MFRRTLSRTLTTLAALAVAIAACSSSTGTATPPTVPPATGAQTAPAQTTLVATANPGTTPTEVPGITQAPPTQAPPTTGATAVPGPTPSPVPATQPPTATPEPSSATPTFAVPSFSFTPDTNLEALFPKTIDGKPVKVTSLHATDIAPLVEATPAQKKAFQTFLAAVGATIDDVTIAEGSVKLSGLTRGITAVRIRGADPNALIQASLVYEVAIKSVPADWATGSATVGGKTVFTLTDTADPTVAVQYGYPYGEVIFGVSQTDPQMAGKLLGALP